MDLIRESLGQSAVETLLHLLVLAVGLALLALVVWTWATAQRRLRGLDRTILAQTPTGETYSVVVPALRIRTPLSRKIFAPDGPGPRRARLAERADHVVDKLDELALLLVPFALAAVFVVVMIFILELILSLVLLGVTSIVATLIRHRWACEVTYPSGRAVQCRARGIRRVHRLRDELIAAIERGNIAAVERATSDPAAA